MRQLFALFMLLGAAGTVLSGCAPAAVGLGTAAVAASTTKKAFQLLLVTLLLLKLKTNLLNKTSHWSQR